MKQENQQAHSTDSPPHIHTNGRHHHSSEAHQSNSSSSSDAKRSKKGAGPWSLFALIFKAACLLLACLTLSFSQFRKPPKTRRSRQSPLPNNSEFMNGMNGMNGSPDCTPTLSPSCSSNSLACNCSTPAQCYCNTLYAVLRVPPNASSAQIRSSYRVLAKQLHPDKQGPASDATGFQRLQEAYEMLTNEERRKEYDVSEGLLGWSSQRAQSDSNMPTLEQLRKLEMQRRKEEMRMEKIRKFEEDPIGSAFENFQKLRQQQNNPEKAAPAATAEFPAPTSDPLFPPSTPLFANGAAHAAPQGFASSSPCASPSMSYRRSTAPTPAAHRSLLLPILAHLSVLALLLLVVISLPIKYFCSILLAQRRKAVWSERQSAQQHIRNQPSTPITA